MAVIAKKLQVAQPFATDSLIGNVMDSMGFLMTSPTLTAIPHDNQLAPPCPTPRFEIVVVAFPSVMPVGYLNLLPADNRT
jgi:hypothetical protein